MSDDATYGTTDKGQDINTKQPEASCGFSPGTRLVNNEGSYRYACAGEDLKANVLVGPGLSEEDRLVLATPQGIEKASSAIYGGVVTVLEDRLEDVVTGWPEVDVKKGLWFWIHEA